MTLLQELQALVKQVQRWDREYYILDKPSVSDQVYERARDRIKELQDSLGLIFYIPTLGECVDFLCKVEHNAPMLSAAKTKLESDLEKFAQRECTVASYKLDGLTIVARYKKGKFVQAITRGNGTKGEDVTHNLRFCKTLPKTIPYMEDLEIRGEGAMTWESFEDFKDENAHPRNIAGGSVRQHDSNVSRNRPVDFIVFDFITPISDSLTSGLDFLGSLGFLVVEHQIVKNVSETLRDFSFDKCPYPCDGLIFRYDNIAFGKSLGATSHHTNDILAYKLADETYETVLRDVEWSVSYDGRIFPTAVFDVVEIDGAKVQRATLHNINYMEDLELGIGDEILVSKRNMIIPCVEENTTRSGTYAYPTHCPCCGSELVDSRKRVVGVSDTKYLICENDDCMEKEIQFLKRAVSKKGFDIDGLSEATVRVLVENGYVRDLPTLFALGADIDLPGFGKRKIEKLLASLDKARTVPLANLIYAMTIPLIGSTAAKVLSAYYKTIEGFLDSFKESVYLDGIGFESMNSIQHWLWVNKDNWRHFISELNVLPVEEKKAVSDSPFNGKTIVVTGTLANFSRMGIEEKIVSLGAKPSGSVSKKTDYLIIGTNPASKMDKAKSLGVPVITEYEFLEMIGENA